MASGRLVRIRKPGGPCWLLRSSSSSPNSWNGSLKDASSITCRGTSGRKLRRDVDRYVLRHPRELHDEIDRSRHRSLGWNAKHESRTACQPLSAPLVLFVGVPFSGIHVIQYSANRHA